MLYLSTRNTTDTFTAHRALHEVNAPDGGIYVPFHLPVFTDKEMAVIRSQSCCETVAQMLNLFFGLHLCSWDVEFKLGRSPFKLESMQHRLLIAEGWRNPEASYGYFLKSLYSLATGQKHIGKQPVGWSCIGIKIALLFGLYTVMDDTAPVFDIAVTACDFSDLAAISYAKKMGLPVNLTVCTCSESSAFWDLINRGELSTNTLQLNAERPDYLECYLYNTLGAEEVKRYLDAAEGKVSYRIGEIQQETLSSNVFAAVVSGDRVDAVISNTYRTNGYNLDPDSALAYGGLQDYRSSTGISIHTLILSKKRPARTKE